MKRIKYLLVIVFAVLLICTAAACVKDTGGNGGNTNTGSALNPTQIVKLKALKDYGADANSVSPSSVSYTETDKAEKTEKLQKRIVEKKGEFDKGQVDSSVVKIFAHSKADKIIDAMARAALPTQKMKDTVDYLAGDETVTDADIDRKVEEAKVAGSWTAIRQSTTKWSFFDDWSFYEKLQDKADAPNATDHDADNVKRQYRNISGKVFAIGMSGDEFARVVVHEMVYGITVVESADMSGASITDKANFYRYCKENLDHETLSYMLAFNEYYSGGNEIGRCVQLYGYYYDYNKTNYDSQNDETFEKQLTYSHQKTFSTSEWLDYVQIQRTTYTTAYRYDDAFYEKYYKAHFGFQGIIEKYDTDSSIFDGITEFGKNTTYSGEMLSAISSNGLKGQLNMTDWLWCYGGDTTAMTAYNAANTLYQDGQKQGASNDAKNEGQFKFEMEQLKAIDYLLTNMKDAELNGALRFQVYTYSGDSIRSIQSYKKDVSLIKNNYALPADKTNVITGLSESETRSYAHEKLSVLQEQLYIQYQAVNVSNKATSGASWGSMRTEIKTALTHDYDTYESWAKKVEALEENVIKRVWDCGAAIGETCPRGKNHAECKKDYAKDHVISQFVSNYEVILRHMAGQSNVSFMAHTLPVASGDQNNYKIAMYTESELQNAKFKPSYKSGAGALTDVMVKDAKFIDKSAGTTITVKAGNAFTSVETDSAEDWRWWTALATSLSGSKPTKSDSTVSESWSGGASGTGTFKYKYEFAGWYLDKNLKFVFNVNDKVSHDVMLYAGYSVVKTKA